jgi:hypothetical protein
MQALEVEKMLKILKIQFFPKILSIFSTQALVQNQQKGVKMSYMAQKKRLGLYFHAHFDSNSYDNFKYSSTRFCGN